MKTETQIKQMIKKIQESQLKLIPAAENYNEVFRSLELRIKLLEWVLEG